MKNKTIAYKSLACVLVICLLATVCSTFIKIPKAFALADEYETTVYDFTQAKLDEQFKAAAFSSRNTVLAANTDYDKMLNTVTTAWTATSDGYLRRAAYNEVDLDGGKNNNHGYDVAAWQSDAKNVASIYTKNTYSSFKAKISYMLKWSSQSDNFDFDFGQTVGKTRMQSPGYSIRISVTGQIQLKYNNTVVATLAAANTSSAYYTELRADTNGDSKIDNPTWHTVEISVTNVTSASFYLTVSLDGTAHSATVNTATNAYVSGSLAISGNDIGQVFKDYSVINYDKPIIPQEPVDDGTYNNLSASLENFTSYWSGNGKAAITNTTELQAATDTDPLWETVNGGIRRTGSSTDGTGTGGYSGYAMFGYGLGFLYTNSQYTDFIFETDYTFENNGPNDFVLGFGMQAKGDTYFESGRLLKIDAGAGIVLRTANGLGNAITSTTVNDAVNEDYKAQVRQSVTPYVINSHHIKITFVNSVLTVYLDNYDPISYTVTGDAQKGYIYFANATYGTVFENISIKDITAANAVTVDSTVTNGTVTPASETAKYGETVSVTVTPASGYGISAGKLIYTYNDGIRNVSKEIFATGNGTDFTFTMPSAPVTVSAVFESLARTNITASTPATAIHYNTESAEDGITFLNRINMHGIDTVNGSMSLDVNYEGTEYVIRDFGAVVLPLSYLGVDELTTDSVTAKKVSACVIENGRIKQVCASAFTENYLDFKVTVRTARDDRVFAVRSYMLLEDSRGNTVTVYGNTYKQGKNGNKTLYARDYTGFMLDATQFMYEYDLSAGSITPGYDGNDWSYDTLGSDGLPDTAANNEDLTRYFYKEAYRENIATVSFLNTLTVSADAVTLADADAKTTANGKSFWDISQKQDFSVIAYLKTNAENASMYDLVIAADGKTLANQNSKCVFYGFSNCTSIDLENYNTDYVVNFSHIFQRCTKLVNINTALLNTSKATMLTRMFDYCNAIKTVDVSTWNTSRVESFREIFGLCLALKTINGINDIDTSSAKSIRAFFYGCLNLENLDVSDWDVRSATDILDIFMQCYKLETIDLSKWKLDSVTSMRGMFNGCKRLVSADLNFASIDFTKADSFNSMFNGCVLLETLDISSWNPTNLTNASSMFNGCTALTTVDMSGWTDVRITSRDNMFNACNALTNVYLADQDAVTAFESLAVCGSGILRVKV